jgi:hypothetical protein
LRPAQTDSAFDHIHEPGGFRRNYILLKANENGVEQPRVANNFIDFLYLFGHFVRDELSFLSFYANWRHLQAGEDLEEDETDDEVEARDEERALLIPSTSRPSVDAELVESPTALHRRLLHETSDLESTPLIKKSRSLSRSVSRARRRSRSIGGPTHGDATVPQAILMVRSALSSRIPAYADVYPFSFLNHSLALVFYFWAKREPWNFRPIRWGVSDAIAHTDSSTEAFCSQPSLWFLSPLSLFGLSYYLSRPNSLFWGVSEVRLPLSQGMNIIN